MMPPQPSHRKSRTILDEDIRFRMLYVLDGTSGLSQRGLADKTGMSLGAVNALLNRLIENGLVNVASGDPAPARFRITYGLSQAGRDEMRRLAGGYLVRRRADRKALSAEISALEADFGARRSS